MARKTPKVPPHISTSYSGGFAKGVRLSVTNAGGALFLSGGCTAWQKIYLQNYQLEPMQAWSWAKFWLAAVVLSSSCKHLTALGKLRHLPCWFAAWTRFHQHLLGLHRLCQPLLHRLLETRVGERC